MGSAFAVTRGVDGTSGRSHSAGVAVEHAVIALDFTNFRSHEAAAANVHDIGSGSSVVGTATAQTISNKTLGSNLAAGGYKITGLADPTNAQDAATKNWTETGLTSQLNQATTQATNAATSATAAASSATAASASQSAAASSASAASTSASNASTSASNAASSASSAASSASTATTQASTASPQNPKTPRFEFDCVVVVLFESVVSHIKSIVKNAWICRTSSFRQLLVSKVTSLGASRLIVFRQGEQRLCAAPRQRAHHLPVGHNHRSPPHYVPHVALLKRS